MAWARDLTAEEQQFLLSLGGVVMFWNHVENSMRVLVQRATVLGDFEERILVLVSQLGNPGLADCLRALADDHQPVRAEHFRHCAALFEAESRYRNYFVHNPMTFLTRGESTKGLAHRVTSRGGSLSLQRGEITVAELDQFHDRLGALQKYISELLEDSVNLRKGLPLSELEKPPMPPKLKIDRMAVIDRSDLRGP